MSHRLMLILLYLYSLLFVAKIDPYSFLKFIFVILFTLRIQA